MTPRHEQITPGAAEAIAAGFAAHVPPLATERLTLRAPRLEDFDDYASIVCTDRRLGFVVLGLEPGDHEVELGYLFLADAEGQGFAREAVRAARGWGFETLKIPTLVSYIDKRNVRSIRLCQALGAVDDTPSSWTPGDVVYRHLNPEGASA